MGKVELPQVPYNIKAAFPVKFTDHLPNIGSITKADQERLDPFTNKGIMECI
jgi:hypothetical protein